MIEIFKRRNNNRIWELDFLRGLVVIYMIIDHIIYDLGYTFFDDFFRSSLKKLVVAANEYQFSYSTRFLNYAFCSGVFILISGVTSTLSKKPLKRGLVVCGCAVAITVVSLMASLFLEERLNIWYGILHLIGTCMLLTPLINKLNKNFYLPLSILLFALGLYFNRFNVKDFELLAIFNFKVDGFYSADFFPLLPFCGIYIVGMYIGKTFYSESKSLFKHYDGKGLGVIRFFGKYSLEFYFIHQAVIYVVLFILTLFIR